MSSFIKTQRIGFLSLFILFSILRTNALFLLNAIHAIRVSNYIIHEIRINSRGENMFFLKNLKFLQNNLSLAELSRKTNISYRTLQDIYANNSNNPKADTLIKISQSYNISIDKLLLCDLEKELEEKQQ